MKTVKLPWDIPTMDRKLYEPICAKSPEDRTPMEALAKKYIDLCAQTVDERDVNIQRAHRAEQRLAELEESEPSNPFAGRTDQVFIDALTEIIEVASGERQVATDDTAGMAWIDKRACRALKSGVV